MPPCSCNTGSRFTVTRPNGSTVTYRSLNEASADQRRNPGSTVVKTQ